LRISPVFSFVERKKPNWAKKMLFSFFFFVLHSRKLMSVAKTTKIDFVHDFFEEVKGFGFTTPFSSFVIEAVDFTTFLFGYERIRLRSIYGVQSRECREIQLMRRFRRMISLFHIIPGVFFFLSERRFPIPATIIKRNHHNIIRRTAGEKREERD